MRHSLKNPCVQPIAEMIGADQTADAVKTLVVDQDGAEQALLGLGVHQNNGASGSVLKRGRVHVRQKPLESISAPGDRLKPCPASVPRWRSGGAPPHPVRAADPGPGRFGTTAP